MPSYFFPNAQLVERCTNNSISIQRHFRNSERGVYAASMSNTRFGTFSMRSPRSIRALKRRKRRAPDDRQQASLQCGQVRAWRKIRRTSFSTCSSDQSGCWLCRNAALCRRIVQYSRCAACHRSAGVMRRKIAICSGLGCSSGSMQSLGPSSLPQQASRFRQCFVELRCVFAAAARIVGFAAAFAADNRSDRLDDFAGLDQ